MNTVVELPAHLEKLLHYGDDETLRRGPEGWHNYIAELGLSAADLPHLLAVLHRWFESPDEDDLDDERDPLDALWCAPIHAWRALGQLGAIEAVAPMLAHADPLDEEMDDWSMEDWRHIFGMIGSPAIAPLVAHMSDGARREYSRVMASNGLEEIARRYPAQREDIVQHLTAQLVRHEQTPTLNAELASSLIDLHAVESAEVIERAYAADVIDEMMIGNWNDARQRLGVEGLGLAPLERRAHWWDQYHQFRQELAHNQGRMTRERQQAKREKAKRKSAAKARKRNRQAK